MKYQQLVNVKTGQRIFFKRTASDTAGEILEMEANYPPFSIEPPVHYHPYQNENFTVLSGEMHIRINGIVRAYGTGSSINIKPGIRHSMWNSSQEEAVVNWKVWPAMNTESFFENMTDLVNASKTNRSGLPPKLPVMRLLSTYHKTIRLDRPPFWIFAILIFLLKPVFAFYKK